MSNKEKPHVVIPTLVPELELEKEVSVLEVVHLPILKELESEGGPEPKTQLFRKDDKPGNEKQGKKNLRTDWLKNKQIIVYNRNEIDDYLSNAFEQILYQVEEKGGDQLQSVALLLPPSNSSDSNRCQTSV
ncbi:hypothetical protein RhiirA5_385468 [Rhizophagus irregularis]|uniref:Uncharacterized protein n=1 Tax=Rhizophagus irregularis TaxID=588596 RepID=A0A2N0NNT9_9GLOM|nr:hypothetical protein RhiirA5_385468 [Rhizophagus irregularis]